MNGVAQRNNAGKYYVNTRLGVAKTQSEEDFHEFGASTEIHKLLTDLVEVRAKGFRGIVVTALTGMHLSDTYDPLNNFYDCNPRSIFEGGIWYALQENGVPCGKSDPLNVAKNINQLDEGWAAGRRPQSSALAVVKFLRLVVKSKKAARARLIDYFFFRLWRYAESISSYKLTSVESSDSSRYTLAHAVINFTLKFPESGTTPQMLVAELLSSLHARTKVNVQGGGESVFGTNTTSKKPADIWLEEDGSETNLYEITVKPVNLKRLDDSLDALSSTGHLNMPVTFICRIPEDVNELPLINGVVAYKGKEFGFIDYKSFCLSMCALLPNNSFFEVMQSMESHINDMHVSMKTKTGWNEVFSAVE